MYAAEKERYRSTENHPLLKAAEVSYEYTHTPPPPAINVGREKMAISLEDEEIIAGVVKSSRSRKPTEFMLEEAALGGGGGGNTRTRGGPITFVHSLDSRLTRGMHTWYIRSTHVVCTPARRHWWLERHV